MDILEKVSRQAKPKVLLPLAFSLLLAEGYSAQKALANPIVPTENGTGSIVTTEGNLHIITGGTVSGDGSNLFHEFQQFNLPTNNIADFISTPEINNILTLTNGGNVSVLDGLLQVTGGNANLFFVNPAGILIGENAALNLRGGFTVTTADQIGFGNNFLSLFDDNNYATLVGTPSTFGFSASNPGVIVNEGDLGLAENQSLTLLGGTVINTGSLSTEDGIITLASVPREHLVRISQTGSLLNLEIVPTNELATLEPGAAIPFDPLSLPELLTGNSGDAVSPCGGGCRWLHSTHWFQHHSFNRYWH
ncbi:MAG: filamentous hemagglutinin N-terminal domain-containing protein [Leptolyngbya sp. SIOISBB]|nr:filamentous hemagglutinin N-terminal domain-containing protein [Leptolyngbya sp. SIOISBB]